MPPGVPLSFDLIAVNELTRATLVDPDGEIESHMFEGAATTATTDFSVTADVDTAGTDWVAVTVEDSEGRMAFSNLI